MSINYVESTTRTNRLHCGECGIKIPKGVNVIYELDDCKNGSPMTNVFCSTHEEYKRLALEERHPFDLED